MTHSGEELRTLRLLMLQCLVDLRRTFARSPEDLAPLLHCAITDLEHALVQCEQQIRAAP